jgi:hypothetical protein
MLLVALILRYRNAPGAFVQDAYVSIGNAAIMPPGCANFYWFTLHNLGINPEFRTE